MATDNLMPQSSTSIIKHFMLRSSTTGQGLTGKVASDFSGKYNIAGGSEVTLSFSSGSPGDAYSSGKIVPLGLGKYAWHVPNAVFASLGNVSAVLNVTGAIDVHCEWLVVAAVRDTVAFGANTTAPPSAAANASQVRTELATELARIDTTIGSRLASASYVSPATPTNVSDAQTAILAKLPSALVSGRIDASVGAYQSGLTPLQPLVAGRQIAVSETTGKVTAEAVELDSASTAAIRDGIPKVGETHRYTQVDSSATTTDVSIGDVP